MSERDAGGGGTLRPTEAPDADERHARLDRYRRSCLTDDRCRRCAAPTTATYCTDECERVIEKLLRELRADVEHARERWQFCERAAVRPPPGVSPGFARVSAGRWRLRVERLEAEIASLLTQPTRGTPA